MTTPSAIPSQRAIRSWASLAVLLVMAHGSAGCGGTAAARTMPVATEEAPAPPALVRLAPGRPLFLPGETMAFELSYGGILTGRAVLAVGEPGEIDGRSVLIVRSQIESAGAAKLLAVVRDTVDTRIDWNTGAPIEHHGQAQGQKRATADIRFDGQRTHIEWQREGQRKLALEVTLPPGEVMHDTHSMLGALRAWEPEPGAQAYFYTVSGRRVWRTDLSFAGSETVRTAMGLRAALHFSGTSVRLHHRSLERDDKRPARRVELWISDDAHRMPLRVVAHTEFGDVQAELVSHDPGQ